MVSDKITWNQSLESLQQVSHPASTIFHKYISKNIGKVIFFLALRWGVTPNALTSYSFLLLSISSVLICIAAISPGYLIFSQILLLSQISYGIDCVDGAVARASNTQSKFGQFYDLAIDRIAVTLIVLASLFFVFSSHPNNLSLQIASIIGSVLYLTFQSVSSIRGLIFSRNQRPEQSASLSLAHLVARLLLEFADTGIFLFLLVISMAIELTSYYLMFLGVLSSVLILGNMVASYQMDKH